MKKYIVIICTGVLILLNWSCSKDSLEPTLAQEKAVETSIMSAEDIQGLLYGAYDIVSWSSYYGRDYIIYNEIMADNAFANSNSGRFLTVSAMDMGDNDGYALNTWTSIYNMIAIANIIINQDPGSLEGDEDEIRHIMGQAYALRAMGHFDLLKLYGQQHVIGGIQTAGIPIMKEYKGDNLMPERNSVAEVKSAVEEDIQSALEYMSVTLNDNSKEFITTYGVYALKSRVALYFEDWDSVVSAAEEIISSGEYEIIDETAFVGSWSTDGAINSIFELAVDNVDNNNINGLSQIYRGNAYGDIQALADIQTIFDAGDIRNSAEMIGIEAATGLLRNMGKYPSADYSDNISIFRYEEVILNYAEALFELDNSDPDALTYLNMVPAKRGALPYAACTKENILKERRRELCFEGFRFTDLARTGSDIPLPSPLEQSHGGPVYGSSNYAFPIPQAEMNANSNMVQNFGY